MTTDMLPETQCHSQPSCPRQRGDRQERTPGRWWKRGLIAIGVVAVIASAATLIPGARSARQVGRHLTHTITRGDLIVTVTEQGVLESSEDTEIKCKVRGHSTIVWVIENGTVVKPGDELVRLDTLVIDDAVNERTKYALWSRSAAERSKANVARAELAIPEYLEGRYHSQLMTLQKDLAIAESSLRTAQNMLDYAELMAEQGYVGELELEEKRFAVTQAKLNVDVENTEIDVLKRFTKSMQLETLNGNLDAAKASLAAAEERAKMDATRRDLALDELEHCVVKAERSGLVIYPSAPPWKKVPEIEEGATVHKDQVLLLMPDLSKMQVKVGIHESVVDRIKPGLAARVTLPDKTLDGNVSSVASVTRPAAWWTGNAVKYDTIIQLPSMEELKPGMSAEVDIFADRHEDVLTIPVAAIVESEVGDFCWVKTAEGAQRRSLRLGDTNDVFTVVEAGLTEGDEVVLNPFAFEQSQTEVRKPIARAKPREPKSPKSGTKSKPRASGALTKPRSKPQSAKDKPLRTT